MLAEVCRGVSGLAVRGRDDGGGELEVSRGRGGRVLLWAASSKLDGGLRYSVV